MSSMEPAAIPTPAGNAASAPSHCPHGHRPEPPRLGQGSQPQCRPFCWQPQLGTPQVPLCCGAVGSWAQRGVPASLEPGPRSVGAAKGAPIGLASLAPCPGCYSPTLPHCDSLLLPSLPMAKPEQGTQPRNMGRSILVPTQNTHSLPPQKASVQALTKLFAVPPPALCPWYFPSLPTPAQHSAALSMPFHFALPLSQGDAQSPCAVDPPAQPLGAHFCSLRPGQFRHRLTQRDRGEDTHCPGRCCNVAPSCLPPPEHVGLQPPQLPNFSKLLPGSPQEGRTAQFPPHSHTQKAFGFLWGQIVWGNPLTSKAALPLPPHAASPQSAAPCLRHLRHHFQLFLSVLCFLPTQPHTFWERWGTAGPCSHFRTWRQHCQ